VIARTDEAGNLNRRCFVKKIILIIALIFIGCASPTAPRIPNWYEGYWICSEVKNTWYAHLTADSLFTERVTADNGNIVSVTFTRGTFIQQLTYISPYARDPMSPRVDSVSISGNADTLYLTAISQVHIFVREYK
jgi:hypothetical protein